MGCTESQSQSQTQSPVQSPAYAEGESMPYTGPPRGVSIEFIRTFMKQHDRTPAFAQMTTTDVCNNIVKPVTAKKRTALIDLILSEKDGKGKPFVGKATIFVSHAWKYQFSDPIDVMEHHAKDHPESYFWFDLFLNNQHNTEAVPQEWWSTTFRESIKQIGAVLLVMSPWNNPIPVTRVWCLWEIMCAILGQPDVKLIVQLPENQRNELRKAIVSDAKAVIQALTVIQAEKAEAFLPRDKEMIFKAINDSVGFEALNTKVKDQLRDWYISSLKGIADETMTSTDQEGAQILGQIGNTLSQFRLNEDALRYLQQSLKIYLDTIGRNHSNTAIVFNNIGGVYNYMEDYDKAIEYYDTSLEINLALNPMAASTASAYNNMGSTLRQKRDWDKAIEYCTKALQINIAVLGMNHPETALSYNNIGDTLNEKGDFDKALEYYEKGIAIQMATLGPIHPLTGESFYNMGWAYYTHKNDMVKARNAFQRALDAFTATLGPNHSFSMDCKKFIEDCK